MLMRGGPKLRHLRILHLSFGADLAQFTWPYAAAYFASEFADAARIFRVFEMLTLAIGYINANSKTLAASWRFFA